MEFATLKNFVEQVVTLHSYGYIYVSMYLLYTAVYCVEYLSLIHLWVTNGSLLISNLFIIAFPPFLVYICPIDQISG